VIVIRGIPLYWGVERDALDRSFFSGSWLMEDLPPFRESVRAVRIRVSPHRWLHIGQFRYNREALHTGLMFKPSDIGQWGKDAETDQEGPGGLAPVDTDDQPVRSDADSGPGASAGDQLAAHG
jgi:hypothetical protein